MVSRETTRPLRKLVPAVAIGVSALLGVVGCGAGQVAQTSEMEPAVNGNMAEVGNLLLRDVVVAFPEDGEAYKAGDDAPLLLTIANIGTEDDELVGVTSPAGKVEITGEARIPAQHALQVVLPEESSGASSSSSTSSESSQSSESSAPPESSVTSGTTQTSEEPPSSGTSSSPSVTVTTTTEESAPDVVGTISLVITGLTGDLPFGKTVPVTFEFRDAGKVTVSLPIGSPATARAEDRDNDMVEGEGEGH